MRKIFSVKLITINAMIAGIYAILTLAISPIAYSQIQFRLSEIIVFLAFYNKNYIPGLAIGCILANMFSPFGILDIIFGTISTIFVCLTMYKIKNKYFAAFLGAIITGIIVGGELWYLYQIPYLINALYIAIGELFVLVIGALIFNILERNERFIKLFIEQ
ncbi:MAG: QueT transporter family protein [[Clostridium] spiroforme]|uniref:QueT transporter family protein n=1 Tax=Thomasclavelia spiroformis TaxID=29348 RepID=A0A943EK69_9FIRM|nr:MULTISPECIES: QueT transporter family protein [Thomasclavelia]MBS5587926.1 QueT transporter family protein [Thomasclavelia spiroformis]